MRSCSLIIPDMDFPQISTVWVSDVDIDISRRGGGNRNNFATSLYFSLKEKKKHLEKRKHQTQISRSWAVEHSSQRAKLQSEAPVSSNKYKGTGFRLKCNWIQTKSDSCAVHHQSLRLIGLVLICADLAQLSLASGLVGAGGEQQRGGSVHTR